MASEVEALSEARSSQPPTIVSKTHKSMKSDRLRSISHSSPLPLCYAADAPEVPGPASALVIGACTKAATKESASQAKATPSMVVEDVKNPRSVPSDLRILQGVAHSSTWSTYVSSAPW